MTIFKTSEATLVASKMYFVLLYPCVLVATTIPFKKKGCVSLLSLCNNVAFFSNCLSCP